MSSRKEKDYLDVSLTFFCESNDNGLPSNVKKVCCFGFVLRYSSRPLISRIQLFIDIIRCTAFCVCRAYCIRCRE